MILVILLLFIYSTYSCNTTFIASCLNQYVDLDGDQKVNATELDEYMYRAPCGSLMFSEDYSGEDIVSFFDINSDNYIDTNDLDAENSYFTRFEQVLQAACQECDKCIIYNNISQLQ